MYDLRFTIYDKMICKFRFYRKVPSNECILQSNKDFTALIIEIATKS